MGEIPQLVDDGSGKENIGGGGGTAGGSGTGFGSFGAGGYGGGASQGYGGGFGLTPNATRLQGGVAYPTGMSALGGTAYSNPSASASAWNPQGASGGGWGGSGASQGGSGMWGGGNPSWGSSGGGSMWGGSQGGNPWGQQQSPMPAQGTGGSGGATSTQGQGGNYLGTQLYDSQNGGYGLNPWGVGETTAGLLNQYLNSGAFGPNGNQGLMDAVQHQALLNGDALRQSAYNSANLYGGDPGQSAYAAIQGNLNSQGGVANAMSQAQLQQLMNQQQFGQGLYTQAQNYAGGMVSGDQSYLHNQLLTNQMGNQGGSGLGSVLGQVGGSLLGTALLPGAQQIGMGLAGLL